MSLISGGHSTLLATSSDGPRWTGQTRSGGLSYRATSKTAGSEQSVPAAWSPSPPYGPRHSAVRWTLILRLCTSHNRKPPADHAPEGGPAGGRDPARAVPAAYRNELISIVSSRPGPTPIAEIGAPDISSSALT